MFSATWGQWKIPAAAGLPDLYYVMYSKSLGITRMVYVLVAVWLGLGNKTTGV